MASSIYIVIHMSWDQSKHNRTKTRSDIRLSDNSVKKYEHRAVAFLDWCKAQFGTNKPRFCRKHIQDYADYLKMQGKSASTIHDYVNSIYRVLGVPLANISKPRRVAAENQNNRRAAGAKAVDQRRDTKAERSPRLHDFASVVGIRSAEYRDLRKNDFGCDESGWPCVIVRNGKNGKRQLQRIPLDAAERISEYFDGTDGYVFSAEELRCKINLHRLRGECARRWYDEYARRIETEPGYTVALRDQLYKRFISAGQAKKWSSHEVEGMYRLRGANREKAVELGLPVEYHRLAVMAVSVFHLSHWRNDVTVSNYLLAI